MERVKKRPVKDLNSILICRLCEGYLVDATTLVECLHTFCRGCILRYFENSKTQCPMCAMVYKKKSQCFRSDTQIQALVYKLVPSLFVKEIQRREDFYRSTGVRAGSSCSDDSVIDKERDMMHETEQMISQCVGDKTQYFSPEDSISLSLEYYQPHLDTTDTTGNKKLLPGTDSEPHQTEIKDESPCVTTTVKSCEQLSDSNDKSEPVNKNNGQISNDKNSSDKVTKDCDKRFLQCPAGVNMKHLQKFIRMKYGLSCDHRVDIIHKGEILPSDYSLMDVAYIFKWEKKNPLRFFYRIFKPMKIRPIKIINTPLSNGEKQLQIVPVTTSSQPVANTTQTNEIHTVLKSPKSLKIEKVAEKRETTFTREETESEQQNKEILLAHLQLQSKSKALQNAEAKKTQVPEKIVKECVFEYEEPDQEEIKRFAERRDREWALQKKLEEEIRPERDDYYSREHYSSKKRKKSKHSKNDSNGHKEKKRKIHADKIHAEITNNDKTDLKLKVKITTNGHKHKHHKIESSDKSELSHKEKLLQMRQVRHKHMSGSSGDEKSQPAIPTIKVPKVYLDQKIKESGKYLPGEPEIRKKKESLKPTDIAGITENNNKPIESHPKPRIEPMIIKSVPSIIDSSHPKTNQTLSRSLSRPEFPTAKIPKIDVNTRVPTVHLERHDVTERHAQKTFLKTTAAHADRYSKDQKIGKGKVEGAKTAGSMSNAKVLPIGSITTNNKSLDRKIASLQQRCTIEPKNPANNVKTDNGKLDKKVGFNNEKSKTLNPQYPPGFTVSKIDNTVKRKADKGDNPKDNRPSLEITLIPPTSSTPPKPTEAKNVAKRPPPGTIPLERIKNAVNLKSGISIIPKMPERTDNIGVLDLSKPNKTPESSPRSSPKNEPINGLNSMVNRQINNSTPRPANSPNRGGPENKNVQLSNLKMLSTVALEHPAINKGTPNNVGKPRPQIPSLQTINRMSSMQHPPNSIRAPGMQRLPPKLNEIQKFRPTNTQIRNMRPNQNQNIRNIPNPSLLMNRQQQNQSRLVSNSTSTQANTTEKKESLPKPPTPVTSTTSSVPKDAAVIKSAILEQKVSEKKEISV